MMGATSVVETGHQGSDPIPSTPLGASDDRRRVDRAVWSFWTAPFQSGYRSRWLTERDHLMSWALSWSTVSRFFETTSLVTDSPGARLLVDVVGLPFDLVVTSLDQLDPAKSDWWTLGKLRAYRQTCPFLHFDSDVFLWSALPDRLLTAEVAAQNPEAAPLDDSSYYKPTQVSEALNRLGGWLPNELRDYLHNGGSTAACTGVFGGCAWEDITEYAATAEQLILSRANQRAWNQINKPFRDSGFVEQYYLAAYCKARLPRPRFTGHFGEQTDHATSAWLSRCSRASVGVR
jgi:hypothetical protein